MLVRSRTAVGFVVKVHLKRDLVDIFNYVDIGVALHTNGIAQVLPINEQF